MMFAKVKYYVIVILLFSTCSLFGQHNFIKVGFGPVPRVGFERTFGEKISLLTSLEFGQYYSGTKGSLNGAVVETIWAVGGFGIMPEARFYPFTNVNSAPAGLFIGVHYRFKKIKEDYTYEMSDGFWGANRRDTTIHNSGTMNDYGINAGYKFSLGDYLGIELLVGYGNSSGKMEDSNARSRVDFESFENRLRAEIAFGIVFPKFNKKERLQKEIKVIEGPYKEH
jgi:hypothetical protein